MECRNIIYSYQPPDAVPVTFDLSDEWQPLWPVRMFVPALPWVSITMDFEDNKIIYLEVEGESTPDAEFRWRLRCDPMPNFEPPYGNLVEVDICARGSGKTKIGFVFFWQPRVEQQKYIHNGVFWIDNPEYVEPVSATRIDPGTPD